MLHSKNPILRDLYRLIMKSAKFKLGADQISLFKDNCGSAGTTPHLDRKTASGAFRTVDRAVLVATRAALFGGSKLLES